jgi:hypothetical protein
MVLWPTVWHPPLVRHQSHDDGTLISATITLTPHLSYLIQKHQKLSKKQTVFLEKFLIIPRHASRLPTIRAHQSPRPAGKQPSTVHKSSVCACAPAKLHTHIHPSSSVQPRDSIAERKKRSRIERHWPLLSVWGTLMLSSPRPSSIHATRNRILNPTFSRNNFPRTNSSPFFFYSLSLTKIGERVDIYTHGAAAASSTSARALFRRRLLDMGNRGAGPEH